MIKRAPDDDQQERSRVDGDEALIARERRLDLALAASGLGLWDWDVNSGEIDLDERFVRMMGFDPREIAQPSLATLSERVHPEDIQAFNDAVSAHFKGVADHFEVELRFLRGDQRWQWIAVRGKLVAHDAAGNPERVLGTSRDIHEQRRTQDRLLAATAQVRLLLDATNDGVIGADERGRVIFLNRAGARMLCCEPEQLHGLPIVEILRDAEDATDPEDTPVELCLKGGGAQTTVSAEFVTQDGQKIPVEYTVSPLEGSTGAVVIFRDSSARDAQTREVAAQALSDPLTGLANRRAFEARMEELIALARESGSVHALCYIDLDNFKIVNDSCGHVAGDELLRQLPELIRPAVRGLDLVARLGGDEFGILLENCPLEDATRVAAKVRDAIRGFRFVWDYRSFNIGASIGVVAIGPEAESPEAVMQAADSACYAAKDKGRNNVHVAYPHDLAVIRRRGEMRWVERLRQAMGAGDLTLYYQSVGRIQGAGLDADQHEILLRLLDKNGNSIRPGSFLPAAERYQMMPEVDRWVIETACAKIGGLLLRGVGSQQLRFSLNVSAASLADVELAQFVAQQLAANDVPPQVLAIELRETAASSNLGAALEFMRQIRALGCRTILDGFGGGVSSFSYLKTLPVDMIKIDGSLIQEILSSEVDASIVRAINEIAHHMGIETVAEFVENAGLLAAVRRIGIDCAQGYTVAEPRPFARFVLSDETQPV